MDTYTFKQHLSSRQVVTEPTSYLEIFSYSDPSFNSVEEHTLMADEVNGFLYMTDRFQDKSRPDSVVRLGGIRLILQQKSEHPDTFAPNFMSLTPKVYEEMTNAFHLPRQAIECSSSVGPLFWSGLETIEGKCYLQIIFRKADVKKLGFHRGWELTLSYDFETAITSGFYKGTTSSHIQECIKHLKACGLDACHPLLLPTIIFSNTFSSKNDIRQREARDWLRRIEHAVSRRAAMGVVDLDSINMDSIECYAEVSSKQPATYIEITSSFKESMESFWSLLPEDRKRIEMEKVHSSIIGRIEFLKRRLQGIDSYAKATLQRLNIQRNNVYNLIAQRESRINLMKAEDSRKLAHASKRDSSTMKVIALLGTLFLPGSYIASIFSTSFFDFQLTDDEHIVSSNFWVYWAVTVPVTLFILGIWYFWEKGREDEYKRQDLEGEAGLEEMERAVMKRMRTPPKIERSTCHTREITNQK